MRFQRETWALLFALSASLAACGGAGKGGGAADDIGVTLSTAGGATSVASGDTLAIRANVTNSATMAVTWSLTGPRCPLDCGAIAPTSILDFATYSAPRNVAAQFSVTVTATSTEDQTKSGSVVLTVQPRTCPPGASLLDGQYAFQLQGFDRTTQNGIAAVGSFTADACGGIPSGTADFYFGPTAAGNAPSLGGSYSMGADNRGTLSLTVGAGKLNFAIALGKISGGVASQGAVTETDLSALGGPVLSGSMWRQDPTAFALKGVAGPYAFVLNGWNGPGPREAMGGTLTADGAGGFAGGPMADKVFGSAPPATRLSWTGTYGAPSSSGRSVVTAQALTGAQGTAVMYVVGPGQLIAMISDTSSSGRVFSGNMLAQTGPFSLASLSGSCLSYQTANYDMAGYEALTTATIALFSANGAGSLSIASYDQNHGGNFVSGSGIQYTYTVDADGQATIYTSPSNAGGMWYLTGPNTGLMLGFDIGVSVGAIVPRSDGPFSTASISGSYFASQTPGASFSSTDSSGVATSTGDGALATTMDLNGDGVVTAGQSANLTLAVAPDGRATDTSNDVMYVISPKSFLMMNETTFYPVIHLFEQ
jgi:hypothetical protein